MSLKRSVPRPPLALHPLQNIGRRPHAPVHHGEQVAEHGPRRRRLPLWPVQEVQQVAVLRLLRELQIERTLFVEGRRNVNSADQN